MDTFKLIGFKGAADDLKKLGKSVTRKTRPVIKRAARRVANQIRDAAPVDTGELKASIKTEVAKSGLSATITATAEHALSSRGRHEVSARSTVFLPNIHGGRTKDIGRNQQSRPGGLIWAHSVKR